MPNSHVLPAMVASSVAADSAGLSFILTFQIIAVVLTELMEWAPEGVSTISFVVAKDK